MKINDDETVVIDIAGLNEVLIDYLQINRQLLIYTAESYWKSKVSIADVDPVVLLDCVQIFNDQLIEEWDTLFRCLPCKNLKWLHCALTRYGYVVKMDLMQISVELLTLLFVCDHMFLVPDMTSRFRLWELASRPRHIAREQDDKLAMLRQKLLDRLIIFDVSNEEFDSIITSFA